MWGSLPIRLATASEITRLSQIPMFAFELALAVTRLVQVGCRSQDSTRRTAANSVALVVLLEPGLTIPNNRICMRTIAHQGFVRQLTFVMPFEQVYLGNSQCLSRIAVA